MLCKTRFKESRAIPFILFSYAGHNLGEAANIATPGWLMVAKDAAIRRASINCPPMVSHFQLLYDLALSLCSRFVCLLVFQFVRFFWAIRWLYNSLQIPLTIS